MVGKKARWEVVAPRDAGAASGAAAMIDRAAVVYTTIGIDSKAARRASNPPAVGGASTLSEEALRRMAHASPAPSP